MIEISDLGKKYQKLAKFTYPSMTQLKNTVHVFLEMQRTMYLSVKDLANGHHQNARYPTKLSSKYHSASSSIFVFSLEEIDLNAKNAQKY